MSRPTKHPQYINQGNDINATTIQHVDATTRDMIILIVLAVLIILINSLIALSFVLVKKLRRRPANMMICSQACTDLFTGVVYIPCSLARTPTSRTLVDFFTCYMLYLSLFNLLLISIDRYLALCKPFLHRRYVYVYNVLHTDRLRFLPQTSELLGLYLLIIYSILADYLSTVRDFCLGLNFYAFIY